MIEYLIKEEKYIDFIKFKSLKDVSKYFSTNYRCRIRITNNLCCSDSV